MTSFISFGGSFLIVHMSALIILDLRIPHVIQLIKYGS
jgi:hypothetical protein